MPNEAEVTHSKHHAHDSRHACGTPLEKAETRTFYGENRAPGYGCRAAHDRYQAYGGAWLLREVPCVAERHTAPRHAEYILGGQVKIYICYLSILIRLSFDEIHNLLTTTYHFEVSDGEIASILEKEARALRGDYENLKNRIREQRGAHYDETTYAVQKEEHGAYAWVITGTETNGAVFDCGKSRGKGVAEKLKGDADHVGITDGYGAYRTLFREHQLCWAHPNRKLRELAEPDTLEETERMHCAAVFSAWGALYADLRSILKEPFVLERRAEQRSALMERFDVVAMEQAGDPMKMRRIKAELRRGRDSYFTCLMHEGIPCDNNKAERALRHLVLKRRTSFGSKTQKGAEAVSILASVLLSLWWTKPRTFFQELLTLRGV